MTPLTPRRQPTPLPTSFPSVAALALTARPFPYRLAAACLILLTFALNLTYLIADCPLELAPDEAHYWDWSRHLAWSYYSKGPLVAWLIHASCALFGDLSVQLIGSQMLAVRFPAVASHAALLAGLYVLAAGALRSPRAGLAAVIVALTLPPVSAAGVLMTIDPPFLACWCWALVGVQRALASGDREVSGASLRWWLFAGVFSALGVLAKYPMLLLPAAVAGFLLVHRRNELRRPGFWFFIALSGLGCVPILLWNESHEWVSFRHVLGQSGLSSGVKSRGIRWFGPAEFAGGQFALLLGFWFVVFAAAAWRFRPNRSASLSLLWWASVPVWVVFFVVSIRKAGQVNWPAAAYLGGAVLAVAWVQEQLTGTFRWRRHLVRSIVITMMLGLAVSLVLRYPAIVRPALVRLAAAPTEQNPTPIRKLDPTGRLQGWRTLAAEVDRLRDRIHAETGSEPIIAGTAWTIPGEVAFYCRDHPEVYSVGVALADRHSQYDLWRPNPVADPHHFRGCTFILIGDAVPSATTFERLEPPIQIIHCEEGVPVAVWQIRVGHGFKGFTGPRPRGDRAGY